ncbi:1-acyl-sn-glycerol-3-phosphate acyltransferase delta isoform X1 [Agelaius phoeniceus]|uniref:1-acyl-sn-glycerol-3-phosphate acyltransferase delta isoform X1 n=1 Tax=Agelaius phoeniceus TaxID=39638 RepID=UPI0040550539
MMTAGREGEGGPVPGVEPPGGWSLAAPPEPPPPLSRRVQSSGSRCGSAAARSRRPSAARVPRPAGARISEVGKDLRDRVQPGTEHHHVNQTVALSDRSSLSFKHLQGCPLNFVSEGILLLSQQIMDIVGFLKSQFICHLLICYIFIVSGLIINFIQLFTLILWPINKQLFRKINCRLAYCISSQMVMLLEWWSGTDCTLYTDPESYHKYGKENAIVILNHNFEIDFLCGWNFCERFGVLGSSKVLAKKELSYMPIIGWMWYFLEIVFCKRKWEEDRKTVVQKLLNLRDYPENFWFLIHCEGTRFTEQKHQISMKVAEAKGLPKLKYHLLPRTKGFAVTVQCLRNVVSAVYDSTLNFRNNENPTLLGVLNGKKYHADLYVRRIPLEDVPEDEQECSTWLHKLYQEKDAFQEEYYRTGTYPAVPTVPPRRPWTLLNWLFWALLLLYPLFQLLINMINSGSSLTLASFAFVIIIASVGVRWMIGVTEINKGSTYGNNDSKQKQK